MRSSRCLRWRASPEQTRRWAASKWQLTHRGVIDHLKDLFALEHHRTKTLGSLLTRLAVKVAAYTCGQCLNTHLWRPLRHLADLLV